MNTQTANESMNHIEKVTQNIMQTCEDIGTAAREHMDATMRATSVAMEGCNEISLKVNGLIQESFARAVSVGKTIATAKSMQEAMDIHSGFVKEAFDSWIAGTGRISEISARVTKEAFDPIAENANNAMGKLAQRTKAA